MSLPIRNTSIRDCRYQTGSVGTRWSRPHSSSTTLFFFTILLFFAFFFFALIDRGISCMQTCASGYELLLAPQRTRQRSMMHMAWQFFGWINAPAHARTHALFSAVHSYRIYTLTHFFCLLGPRCTDRKCGLILRSFCGVSVPYKYRYR